MRLGPLYIYNGDGLFWFRIWNKGLSFRDKTHPKFNSKFSERIGKKKYLDLFKQRITILN